MRFYETKCTYSKTKSDAYQATYAASCGQELIVEIPMEVNFGYDTRPEIRFCPGCGLPVEIVKK